MRSDAQWLAAGLEAWENGVRGDFQCSDALIHAPTDRPCARAWQAALSALRWHAQPSEPMPLDAASLGTLLRDDACVEPLIRAALLGVHSGALAFDSRSAQTCAELIEALSPSSLEGGLATSWLGIMRGAPLDPEPLERSLALAREHGRAAALVQSEALLALQALCNLEIDKATSFARRASRMGRTESIPQMEYLANLCLARVRRCSGRGHLTSRILFALIRVAPAQWHPWMAWELRMVDANPDDAVHALPSHARAFAAQATLGTAIEHTRGGQLGAFRKDIARLRELTQGFAIALHDLEQLETVCDPDAARTGAWQRGEQSDPPAALRGLCHTRTESENALWVAIGPNTAARRTIALALPLFDGFDLLSSENAGRVEATAAALSLAPGHTIEAAQLFKRVYGFEYEAARHKGVFDVLLHRVRERFEGYANIVREGQSVRFVVTQRCAFADPTWSQPVEERFLRYLAQAGPSSAKDLAAQLGCPIRSAHRALQRLVDEGAIDKAKQGRNVSYLVEDTTFQEPTRVSSSKS